MVFSNSAALGGTAQAFGGLAVDARPVGPRAKVKYTITTVTGDLPGGGTPAGVFITLHGTVTDSRRFQLLNEGEVNFQRGRKDVFAHTDLDLGEIESVTISHDGRSGFKERFDASWFLERVVVRGAHSEWAFPCRRWLSTTKEDRQTRRTLYSRVAEQQISYQVLAFTEDRPEAGTRGRVHIQLTGTRGPAGGWTELRNPSVHDVFERGNKDLFLIKARHVGPLVAVSLRHAAPDGRAWRVAGIVVRNLKTHEEFTFPASAPLGSNDAVTLQHRAGAQISVGASPAAQALEERAARGLLKPPGKPLFLEMHDPYKGMQRQAPAEYDVVVKTADVRNGGTDSNVFIRLFGTLRNSPSIRLAAHAVTTSRLFVRGQTDRFKLFLPDLGLPVRLSVWLDGRSLNDQGASWHLGSIAIARADLGPGNNGGSSWTFPCNRCLDPDAGSAKLDLIPASSTHARAPSPAPLRPRPRPASAAPGRQQLGTREGSSGAWAGLRATAAPGTAGPGGRTVEYRGAGGGGGRRPTSASAAGGRATVLYDDTEGFGGGGGERRGGGMPGMGGGVAQAVRATYKVVVKTGDRPYSGTDCEVMLRVKGELRSTGTHRLSACPVNHTTLFQRGAHDEFLIQDWDIGAPRQVSIWHDGKGSDPHWFLDKVVVTDPRGRQYAFKCGEWLSPTEGKRQLRAELLLS